MKHLKKLIALARTKTTEFRLSLGWTRRWMTGGLALGLGAPLLMALNSSGGASVVPFCLGDGTGASCPCGNSGGPGQGCKNSAGAGAHLTATGVPDIQADTLQLHAAHCPPNTPGVFFGGSAGNGHLPFGNGLRCVSGDIVRVKVAFCNPAGLAHSGTGIGAAEGLTAGQVRYYQFWFRDIIGPCGAAYNTSNGVRVQW